MSCLDDLNDFYGFYDLNGLNDFNNFNGFDELTNRLVDQLTQSALRERRR